MKYKLLKQIESYHTIPIGNIFDIEEHRTTLDVLNPECSVSIEFLIAQWYIEKIEDKIQDPKFSVWEKIIYEDKNLIFFTEIKWIRILEWEVMYYLFDWFYKEENIKRASVECQDKKSKFYNIYPY